MRHVAGLAALVPLSSFINQRQTAVPVFHVFVTGALPFASPTLCGQTMTSKRPRSDSSNPPDTPEAALATIHQLIRQFSLDPAMLKDDDSGPGLSLLSGCAKKLRWHWS